MGVGGQQHALAILYPLGKTWYQLYRRLGGPQGQSGQAENLAPQGSDPRTVQPVVSLYTDWATQHAHTHKYNLGHMFYTDFVYEFFVNSDISYYIFQFKATDLFSSAQPNDAY